MSKSLSGLTFAELRQANMKRMPLFAATDGTVPNYHREWDEADWFVAVVGELGEAANVMKKIKRGDFPRRADYDAAKARLAREFADTVIYLDILAAEYNIDLGEIVRLKFDEKSREKGLPEMADLLDTP